MPVKSITVLLIEHNPAEAERIREMLRSASVISFRVEQVDRLEDALIRLRHPGLDAAILDCGIPDGTGVNKFRARRRDADWST